MPRLALLIRAAACFALTACMPVTQPVITDRTENQELRFSAGQMIPPTKATR